MKSTIRQSFTPAVSCLQREMAAKHAGFGLVVALFFMASVSGALAFDFGQTGGGSLSGQLTVNVVNGVSGAPIVGAWVLVGLEANDPFEGNYGQTTGPLGRIVFTDAALSGPQTVTVTG